MKIVEARSLIDVKATIKNKILNLKWVDSDNINRVYMLKGENETFSKLLKTLKAKDNFTEPKSKRGITYKQMVEEIQSGTDTIIYIWSNILSMLPAKKEK